MTESGSNILVVDDNPFVLETTTLLLAGNGYNTVGCKDAASALDTFKAKGFDAVLTDVKMPGMSGLEVCRSIKSDPLLAHTRILILSCQGQNFDWQLALELGADGYITKPFDTGVLIDKVKELSKR